MATFKKHLKNLDSKNKMVAEKRMLNLATIVLTLAGIMDVIRGFAHTFRVREAAVKGAGIELIPDSLFLLGAFGISNFLTAFLFFLIIWKTRKLAPYVLILIPISYILGGIGLSLQNVEPQAPFRGQQMMAVYLAICFFTSILYFIVVLTRKLQTNI